MKTDNNLPTFFFSTSTSSTSTSGGSVRIIVLK